MSDSYQLQIEAQSEGDPSGRTVRFVGSTSQVDSHRSILVPAGMRGERYRANPVVSYNHAAGASADPDLIIGRSLSETVLADRIEVVVEFEDGNPVADKVLRKVRNGYLRGMSVKFLPIREHRDGEVRVVDEWEPLDFSVVDIPSNPGALRRSVTEEDVMDAETLKKLGLEEGATFEDAVAACLQYMANTEDDKETRGKVLAAVMAMKPAPPEEKAADAKDDEKPAADEKKPEPEERSAEMRSALDALKAQVTSLTERLDGAEKRSADLEQRGVLRNRLFGERRSAADANFGPKPEASPTAALDARIAAAQARIAADQAHRTGKRA